MSAPLKVTERTGGIYTAYLKDADGTVIPLANITTITLTLYDADSDTIINSRNQQNVKVANNVTIHATSGLLTWTMQVLDNVIVSSSLSIGMRETHKALFEFTGTFTGTPGKHEATIQVLNLGRVPASS